jgi:DnaJ-class molecular chaperone
MSCNPVEPDDEPTTGYDDNVVCEDCGGSGKEDPGDEPCERCGGTGEFRA